MQGINAKEHQKMLEFFRTFEELSSVIKDTTTSEEENYTNHGMQELIERYQHFKYLLSELQACTLEYVTKKKSVQSVMFKSIRKMNSELRKRAAQTRY